MYDINRAISMRPSITPQAVQNGLSYAGPISAAFGGTAGGANGAWGRTIGQQAYSGPVTNYASSSGGQSLQMPSLSSIAGSIGGGLRPGSYGGSDPAGIFGWNQGNFNYNSPAGINNADLDARKQQRIRDYMAAGVPERIAHERAQAETFGVQYPMSPEAKLAELTGQANLMNEMRYDEAKKLAGSQHQQQLSAAQQRQADMLATAKAQGAEARGIASNYGQSMIDQINSQYKNQRGQAQQSLASRGLGRTTIVDAINAVNSRNQRMALNDAADQTARLKLSAMGMDRTLDAQSDRALLDVLGDRTLLNVIASRDDIAPDLGLYYQALARPGALGQRFAPSYVR